MALTNIELYEALKKDLNDEAVRMIAEVVPKAEDMATKADIAGLRIDIADLKAYIDSRLFRLTTVVLLPLIVTMLGTIGALVALVIKL